jgi:hypothetical protein
MPKLTDPVKKPATRSDSLAVYNNAVKVDKFYSDPRNQYRGGGGYGIYGEDVHKINDERVEAHRQGAIKNPNWETGVRKNGKWENMKVPLYLYRQDIDQNRYAQRELATAQLNLDAPLQLFDRRIEPNSLNFYSGGGNMDQVNAYQYDPLAVKPWDLLDESQKKERISKYGYSGTPMAQEKKTHLLMKSIEFKQEPRETESLSRIEPRLPSLSESRPTPMDTTVQSVPKTEQRFQGGFVDESVANDSTIRSDANRQVADDELLTKHQLASKYGLYKGIRPNKMSKIEF